MGLKPVEVNGLVNEMLMAHPRISILGDHTRSISNSNIASLTDPPNLQAPQSKRRKIVRSRPVPYENVRVGSRRFKRKLGWTATA